MSSGVIEHYAWDGDEHYFSSAAENIRYNNLALMQANASLQKTLTDLVVNFDTSPAESSEPYKRPVTYHAMQTLNVPRDVLPANGTLKIWFPLPINSGPKRW